MMVENACIYVYIYIHSLGWLLGMCVWKRDSVTQVRWKLGQKGQIFSLASTKKESRRAS